MITNPELFEITIAIPIGIHKGTVLTFPTMAEATGHLLNLPDYTPVEVKVMCDNTTHTDNGPAYLVFDRLVDYSCELDNRYGY